MEISDEAVESAAKALAPNAFGWERWPDDYRRRARHALEAAAPHLMAAAWERGRVDGYHHRPNPYKEAGE